jgi:uncharacterized protein YegL
MAAIGDSQFVENPEPRCPVVLVLDTSSSMRGDPIAQLNEAVSLFKREISADAQASLRVEVAIVTFGGGVQFPQDFVTVSDFRPVPFVAVGNTPMGAAIELAVEKLNERKLIYKKHGIYYYRPWLWLITDGDPTDYWQGAARKIRMGEDLKNFLFFAVGVRRANMEILKEISPLSRPPMKLQGLKFKEMFLWLSASMKRASASKAIEKPVDLNPMAQDQLALPPIDGWGTVSNQ